MGLDQTMKNNKEYIIEYMLKHTYLSRSETAKMFRVSTATIARWRKEIKFSKLFQQEEEQPQNDTGKDLESNLIKPEIEEAQPPHSKPKLVMTEPNIQNENIQFECFRKCYFRRKLYEVGEIFFNKDGVDMPPHFRAYDPENPVRTQMSASEMLASVGH